MPPLTRKGKEMDDFLINYVGFLALFSIDSERLMIRDYERLERFPSLNKINKEDGYQPPSLAVKHAYDLQHIKLGPAIRCVRLLQFIRESIITSKNFNPAIFVANLTKIPPFRRKDQSPLLLRIYKQLIRGEITLAQYASKIFILSQRREIREKCSYFRALVFKGRYIKDFSSDEKQTQINIDKFKKMEKIYGP